MLPMRSWRSGHGVRPSNIRQIGRRFTTSRLPVHGSRKLHGYIGSAVIPVSLCALVAGYCTNSSLEGDDSHGNNRRKAHYHNRLSADSREDVSQWPNSPPLVEQREPHRKGSESRKQAQHYESVRSVQPDHQSPGQQKPPSQTRVISKGEEKKAEDPGKSGGSWLELPRKIVPTGDDVASIGDAITEYIIPDWVRTLQRHMTKLQQELSMAPGSLAEEIWWEAHDPQVNPEIVWDASVRVSNDLCDEEKSFLQKRQSYIIHSLAKYLDLNEDDIHPDDVPIIAMCGSGGGLRALVAGASSYLSAKEAGLFDCVTYIAGVSGSCWLQALYYSSITGQSHEKLIRHLKNRLGVHIAFPPAALSLLSSAPTNKYLLTGFFEKFKGMPDADYGIVDIYGLLLAARLFVPKGELSTDISDLKLSHQRIYTDDGSNPMPIYTAVRHEIPIEKEDSNDPATAAIQAKQESWFQWYEFTPYEFWCEELQAGIPAWALGRKFDKGKTVWRDNGLALPELRLPLLLGIWGSAFCATLSHYYREIRPLVKGLMGFAGIDQMIAERDGDLIKVHPIDPATIPNFAFGMRDMLPPSCPESMFEVPNLQLMDAGMSNNLPIYPLLRPGRNVDILIAFDASADVKTDNWLKVADGYARQRGIKGWPVGAGWPPVESSSEEIRQELNEAQAKTDEEATDKVAEARREQAEDRQQGRKGKDLGYCNVWVGTMEERVADEEPPPSKLVEEDWELMRPESGIAVVYFPFLPNPKVEGVDPKTSDFMSTWNFVYTPEQIDSVVRLAQANFDEGSEQTRRTVRAVYERKKARRLARENAERERFKQWKLRMGLAGKQLGEGDHGDQFS